MNFEQYVELCSTKLRKDGFNVFNGIPQIQTELISQRIEDSTSAKIGEAASKLNNVRLFGFARRRYPIDFIACNIGYFETSPPWEVANEYSMASYTFASEYAKAMIEGHGNSRIFYPIFVSEKFDQSFVKALENRDPIKSSRSIKGLGGTYLHIVFPILVDLVSTKLTFYPKKNFLGRMYYGKMQDAVQMYFQI
jgi:hypothetical protein